MRCSNFSPSPSESYSESHSDEMHLDKGILPDSGEQRCKDRVETDEKWKQGESEEEKQT